MYENGITSNSSFVANAHAATEQFAFYRFQIFKDLVRILSGGARTSASTLVRVRSRRQLGVYL